MSIEVLRGRVTDYEDSLTERKSSWSFNDGIKAIVGFANSVPENRTGVLFVGVNNEGNIIGVDNPDKFQKNIRNICERECYPPIWANIVALTFDDKTVIAIEVPYCKNKPYFAGQAYIRSGSETKSASDELYNDLILHHVDKCHFIIKFRNSMWTVVTIGKNPGELIQAFEKRYIVHTECKIEDITAHYVRFKNIKTGGCFTEELAFVNISWDDERDRPRIVIR